MIQLPGPVRAAVGLVAAAADTVRNSPEVLVEIPMLAVSTALQASIRTQQRYAHFLVRGDEVLSRLRSTPDAPPSWATFDDELAVPARGKNANRGNGAKAGRTGAKTSRGPSRG